MYVATALQPFGSEFLVVATSEPSPWTFGLDSFVNEWEAKKARIQYYTDFGGTKPLTLMSDEDVSWACLAEED